MRKFKVHFEWLLAILFTLSAYVFGLSFLYMYSNNSTGPTKPFWLIPALIGLIIAAIIIVYCIIKIFTSKDVINDAKALRRVMLFVKLIFIPINVANFFLTFLATGLFTILPTGIIFTPIVIVIGSTISIVMIATTSAYSISAIIISYRAKRLKISETIVYTIFQFIYVLDVIFALVAFFVCYSREKSLKIVTEK